MQTVIETPTFVAAARREGLGADEIAAIVEALAAEPKSGDVIEGTGGCRKVRFAGRGKGKSGGYRVVTFYCGAAIPLFLLTIYGKGRKANLSRQERNALRGLTATLVSSFRR